ncbi:hypothetical protein MUA90_04065 [Staphylococcus sp. IVB6181]|uniref:DUF7695 domain-containing protein n=1 Tax=Staphylococcus sp. IVB6181 TaxID=2929481 RepID=UPI0021CE55F2|nr:hypothetical protein [Staphylococcus sp. IVB6181]UXV35699.1 hypothetical protein MUA90_04065 [Staphylococcus sp. IVB6181]
MKKIIRNIARCKMCGDIIESKHRHDFVGCKCGCIYLDGGTDYQRFLWNTQEGKGKESSNYIDLSLSVYEEEDENKTE